ncbi:hypothetical protein [Streptomyces sp. NPDC002785]
MSHRPAARTERLGSLSPVDERTGPGPVVEGIATPYLEAVGADGT